LELEHAEHLKVKDLSDAEELIKENIEEIKTKWNEVHGN